MLSKMLIKYKKTMLKNELDKQKQKMVKNLIETIQYGGLRVPLSFLKLRQAKTMYSPVPHARGADPRALRRYAVQRGGPWGDWDVDGASFSKTV